MHYSQGYKDFEIHFSAIPKTHPTTDQEENTMYRYIPHADLPKNLCSLSTRTWDGHGGHAEEHRAEMEQIADTIVQKRLAEMLPEIQRAATE